MLGSWAPVGGVHSVVILCKQLVVACARHWFHDCIIQTKYIAIIKKIQWVFHFTLMIFNDTLNLFLRIKFMWRQYQKHSSLTIFDVDYVRLIHDSHLTLASEIGPLKTDNADLEDNTKSTPISLFSMLTMLGWSTNLTWPLQVTHAPSKWTTVILKTIPKAFQSH